MPEVVLSAVAVGFALGALAAWSWVRRSVLRERALLEERLQQAASEARQDQLTGLWNRKAFDEHLVLQTAIAHRYYTPLSLILADVDGLKSVNDTRGHAAGDELLRSIARVLRDRSRESDLPARIGGDEFAVLLPQTDLAGAQLAAARIADGVPLSLGVAALQPDESGAALVHRADLALYRAKESGGGRVAVQQAATAPAPG